MKWIQSDQVEIPEWVYLGRCRLNMGDKSPTKVYINKDLNSTKEIKDGQETITPINDVWGPDEAEGMEDRYSAEIMDNINACMDGEIDAFVGDTYYTRRMSGSRENREQKFTEKAEALGYEVDSYSGRSMYGRYCPSVNVDYANDFIAEMGMKGLKVDNMGKGYVVYTG